MPVREIQQSFDVRYSYPVVFTRSAFEPDNAALRSLFERAGDGPHRVLAVFDSGVHAADPGRMRDLRRYAEAHADVIELTGEPFVVRGGEVCKSDPVEVPALRERIAEDRICRHSFVLAVGGGSVLDAAGYAAATAHRGVRLIRMPTTVLAQNDAGVGVKNAVNLGGRKNFVGTFSPPFAVLNDFDFLASLGARDLRAGLAEAVKVALIRDRAFFDELHGARAALAAFEPDAMEWSIVRCAELHLDHIATSGDPFELGSARPLDFGHWCAHRLEELSQGELRHGEAVAIGLAVDALYSRSVERIGDRDLHSILETLTDMGFELRHPCLGQVEVQPALDAFREHLGGELSITLLDGIGAGVEVNAIDTDVMRKCLDIIAHRKR